MKQITVVPFLILAFSASSQAQSAEEEIARAVMAAPPALMADAGVVRLADDGSHEVLRESSNGLVCYDRSTEPGRDFSTQCTSVGNLRRAGRNHKVRMSSANAEGASAMFESQENDGSREPPDFGSVWYTLNGSDQASTSTNSAHITIAVPRFLQVTPLDYPVTEVIVKAVRGSWKLELPPHTL